MFQYEGLRSMRLLSLPILLSVMYGGDGPTGKLTSPHFTIRRRYINFLIGGGGYPGETCMNLRVDGEVVRSATGPNTRPGGSEALDWRTWDVSALQGRSAVIEIVDTRSGGWGHVNVDQIVQSDRRAESPGVVDVQVSKPYLLLPVARDAARVEVRLSLHGEVVRYFSLAPAVEGVPPLYRAPLDVEPFLGKTLQLLARPRSAAAKLAMAIRQAGAPCRLAKAYHEPFRPQFHFTPQTGWTNDPNGLAWYGGEYHLFFQHNPFGIRWGNMTWGHAVSRDLVHWEEVGDAVLPDRLGTIFSGSAVVDHGNTSGLGRDGREPLCCFYTSAGAFAPDPRPYTQSMAYSLDGRRFTKYAGNPVLENLEGSNRDPKVFWYAPGGHWVMVLYVRRGSMHIFNSLDLKTWRPASVCDFPGAHECPELFPLPVEGDERNMKWVIWEGGGRYRIGRFDGRKFTPETGVLHSERGGDCYAGQTWNDAPGGRRIFIGWMRGNGEAYPGMPFNQQMTFPRRITLRSTEAGIRVFAEPPAQSHFQDGPRLLFFRSTSRVDVHCFRFADASRGRPLNAHGARRRGVTAHRGDPFWSPFFIARKRAGTGARPYPPIHHGTRSSIPLHGVH